MNKLLLIGTCIFVTLSVASCSKDENTSDPEGTISVNIMNEDHGKTEIGNSDVYIDKANNFHTRYCLLSHLGKKNSLGSISAPVIEGVSDRVAVEPGNAYQIFKNEALREFPSGKLAFNIRSDYYNMYVVAPIEKDGAVIGANVKFVLMDAPDNNSLPEYNTNIGTLSYTNDQLTFELPASDFEVEPAFASSDYYTIEYENNNNKLTVRLLEYKQSDIFGFYIRVRDSYTYVYGKVK
ncbi:MAG TPA: hypothetical protein DDZ96_05585 [Porphyromonadaceae bacterium]|jgi:hypothetical protein|nr:hypothetical protein [Porphyromonadaceae bacterium]HBX21337.1 hypothetical protein [Porphyromonadaceae bacterium]HCM21977.1 hypothetical protein [Porphyromonadaceae bacterium]